MDEHDECSDIQTNSFTLQVSLIYYICDVRIKDIS